MFAGWFKETNLHSYDSGSGLLPVAWGLIICQDHRGAVCMLSWVNEGVPNLINNKQQGVLSETYTTDLVNLADIFIFVINLEI